jgi:hypothetical protein
MKFARGHKKLGGRKKGTPNKLTATVKDAIAQVAEIIGGVERMAQWVQEDPDNEKAFWVSIYRKLSVQHASDAQDQVQNVTFTWESD